MLYVCDGRSAGGSRRPVWLDGMIHFLCKVPFARNLKEKLAIGFWDLFLSVSPGP